MSRWRARLDQYDPRELREWLASVGMRDQRRELDKSDQRDVDAVFRFLQRPEVQEEIKTLWEQDAHQRVQKAPAVQKAEPRQDRGLNRTGWVASLDVYEALDALAPDQAAYHNEVHVRRADAGMGGEKVFAVDRVRNIGTERFLTIADAVRFVLNPPELVNPFAEMAAPKTCPQCQQVASRVGSAPTALEWCAPCAVWMCRVCLGAHRCDMTPDPAERFPRERQPHAV